MGDVRDIIFINGPGGQGRDILDALLAGGAKVSGVLDHQGAPDVLGVPVLGPASRWPEFAGASTFILGLSRANERRLLGDAIRAAGGELGSVIHPAASVSPFARLGVAVAVLGGCVVAPDATLGDYTVLNANCAVDHDCVLGVSVQFGPGVTLAGGVVIGDSAFLGVGATVLPGVTIGANAVIGGGAVVVKPVPEGMTVVGNPARPLG